MILDLECGRSSKSYENVLCYLFDVGEVNTKLIVRKKWGYHGKGETCRKIWRANGVTGAGGRNICTRILFHALIDLSVCSLPVRKSLVDA